jgi:hypothetical protein
MLTGGNPETNCTLETPKGNKITFDQEHYSVVRFFQDNHTRQSKAKQSISIKALKCYEEGNEEKKHCEKKWSRRRGWKTEENFC